MQGKRCKLKRGRLVYTICGFQSRPINSKKQVILHKKDAGNNYKIISMEEFKKKWIIVK